MTAIFHFLTGFFARRFGQQTSCILFYVILFGMRLPNWIVLVFPIPISIVFFGHFLFLFSFADSATLSILWLGVFHCYYTIDSIGSFVCSILLLDSFFTAIITVVVVAFIYLFFSARIYVDNIYLIHNFNCHWIDSIREFFFSNELHRTKIIKFAIAGFFNITKYVYNIKQWTLTHTHIIIIMKKTSFYRWSNAHCLYPDNNVLNENSWNHETWNNESVYVTQYHHFELIELYLKSHC